MLDILLTKPKYILYAFMIIIVGYLYYDNIVVPQNRIEKLEEKLIEKTNLGTVIINKINESDANRTQKEINDVETEITIIRDNGVLVF